MTDAEPLFIDTNILIYANVSTAPLHEQALKAIKNAHQAGRPLWISRQVLREFIAARTRPQTFAQPSTPEVATMKAYGIPTLLTHNIKDFERFGEVIRIVGIDS